MGVVLLLFVVVKSRLVSGLANSPSGCRMIITETNLQTFIVYDTSVWFLCSIGVVDDCWCLLESCLVACWTIGRGVNERKECLDSVYGDVTGYRPAPGKGSFISSWCGRRARSLLSLSPTQYNWFTTELPQTGYEPCSTRCPNLVLRQKRCQSNTFETSSSWMMIPSRNGGFRSKISSLKKVNGASFRVTARDPWFL